ncbi:hypothetical protein BofuT4_P064330.1 [Botrytis cinerea T4]|uniref:Uncharacterized protein n=1 Tax=Botryotinia fuckeliana (strain T4) TaxID=999810 RepID=G2XSW3_BOTF4|nr:hypothetical protein BofuT4_P064330.1 [Botrytis cinerea T4]
MVDMAKKEKNMVVGAVNVKDLRNHQDMNMVDMVVENLVRELEGWRRDLVVWDLVEEIMEMKVVGVRGRGRRREKMNIVKRGERSVGGAFRFLGT